MAGDYTGYADFSNKCYLYKIGYEKLFFKKFYIKPEILVFNFYEFNLFYDYYQPLLGGWIIKNRKNKRLEYEYIYLSQINFNCNYIINKNFDLELFISQMIPFVGKKKEFIDNIDSAGNIDNNFDNITEKSKKKMYGGTKIFFKLNFKIL